MLALVLEGLTPTLAAARIVLDVAPVPVLSRLLARDTGGLYLPIDIDPAADSRRVMMQADLTRIPLPDDSVDVIMCTQVLEHVPDDLAAMREIRRVLSPNGIAFVNIPFRPGTVTDEDPSAPVEERIRRFGQADHVRFYGDDCDDRLRAAGLGFAALARLDLDIAAEPQLREAGDRLLEDRHCRRQLCTPCLSDQPVDAHRPFQRIVMHHDRHAVGGQFDVDLDPGGPAPARLAEAFQGVFQRVSHRSAMANDFRQLQHLPIQVRSGRPK